MTRLEDVGAVLDINTGDLENLRKIATIEGNPQIVSSPFEKSMKFDGTDDYIEIQKSNDLELSTGQDMSYSMKIKLNSNTAGYKAVYDKRNNSPFLKGFLIWIYNGTLTAKLYYNTTSKVVSYSGITTNQWYSINITLDRSSLMKLYVDGELKNSTNISSLNNSDLSNNTNARIGYKSYSSSSISYFDGVIDEVLITPFVLSSQEVLNYHQNKSFDYEKNCVLSLDMSNENPQDLTNNGNDGTSTGTTIVNSFDGGKATHFNGSNEYINVGNDSSLSFGTGDFTLSCWFKFPTNSKYQIFIDKKLNSGNYDGYTLQITPTNRIGIVLRSDGVTKEVSTPNGYGSSGWHLLTGIRNNDTLKIYVDGILKNSLTGVSGFNGDNSVSLGVGLRTAGLLYDYTGSIDKVRIFNKALTQLEIKDLYNKQRRGIQ